MTIAIAVTPDSRVANHFAKAPQFAIYDNQGCLIDTVINEEGSGCQQKKKLLATYKAHGVKRIVLRHIGERSLARLLDADIQVDSINRGATVAQVLAGEAQLTTLTEANEGRKCKPKSSGKQCCGSKKTAEKKRHVVGLRDLPAHSEIKSIRI